MTREESKKILTDLPDRIVAIELPFDIGYDYKEALKMAISALFADVRPNIHARWESDGHGHIICTACKGANVSTWKSRFCPMCGAIMDGEVEPKGAESEGKAE